MSELMDLARDMARDVIDEADALDVPARELVQLVIDQLCALVACEAGHVDALDMVLTCTQMVIGDALSVAGAIH